MAESTPLDDLLEYAMEVLAEGPLPLGELVERLDQAVRRFSGSTPEILRPAINAPAVRRGTS